MNISMLSKLVVKLPLTVPCRATSVVTVSVGIAWKAQAYRTPLW